MNDKDIFTTSIYKALTPFEINGLMLRDFFNAADISSRQISLRHLCADSEPLQQDEALEVEYDFNALFVGPATLLAPPYASVYLGDEPLLMGATTLSVREFLQSMGLVVTDENAVPDDHISVELELAVMLCAHARTSPHYHDALARFVTGHLELWLPAFIEKINQRATTPAIKRLALQLTNWFDELKTRVIL
ncbi:molecular chaperone TorD family protein [Enterobacter wuhouensis]|uniref:Molecular chaperone TorD family protein n=1 Tax=Enterobacter wuhouensis TaxID=2529381 RepID=A0ABZ1DJE3_9ENTR|nr:molecular chaperone TorD family protein [Enterobacter wuhouensis]WRW32752.1 molecular chaperone TorD family protein [Enterobacter wuhouensis]